jgi:paraquat-inducible protein A
LGLVATAQDSIAACRSCDLRQTFGALPPGDAALCQRCGDVLFRQPRVGLDVALAFAVTAFVLFMLANAYPLVTFELAGRSQSGRLISGVIGLYREGYWELAALVCFTTILAPLLYLLGLLFVLISVTLGWRPWGLAPVFRAVLVLTPWAMMEVYTLGILVALVKLGDFGQVVPGVALVAFFCLTFVIVATNAHLDREEIWERIAEAPVEKVQRHSDAGGMWSCGVCELLVEPAGEADPGDCPRCGAALERRKTNSLARTWALLMSGYILYIPANLFPVMVIVSFGKQSTSTIFAGVIELAQGGMLPIAVLVFCASIAIPILKLVALTFVAASVQFRWAWRPATRTRLYRLVEGIGRWSMIDVFVISILVALIQLERVATIEPSLGAICFAAVVILTMFAAKSFDPRLIWDSWEPEA